ncbi:type III polyketide synthase [Bacteriovorax sp. DB6_IX]|uniref:type III polyketide synthase n=1 Tax=Bacteriovorax sp. DB6_IX TaxID=1353530 RepID=UPI00038A2F8C|nr:3-oxoacyl-[acyl-carrier-protein] synthase III C-terminal domain-containing protein [Bacteriovorax sp. DB6_IX]EQC49711.1 chalcone and stilbene synthase [Bacteriovorax sp. DB6_IX]
MSYILASKTVFPEHEYSQDYFLDMLSSLWPDKKEDMQKFTKSVCVDNRAMCIEVKDVLQLKTLAQRNAIWKEEALKLAKRSIVELLQEVNLELSDISQFITTSVTGFSIPSLDTLLMNELEFSPSVKRLPLFGFGCLGGVASLNRAHDYLKANPKDIVLVSAVELCSLTFQMQDLSLENLIGSSLFGDGAASVILVGDEHPLAKESKYEVLDYGAYFYRNTEDTMGWDIRDSGFKLVLNKNVSKIVMENIPDNVSQLTDRNNYHMNDIKFSISHPGGPKVLIAMQEALGFEMKDFQNSWDSLRKHGNMSSVSVLNVLEDSIKQNVGNKDEIGVMAAMGPGFNSEITLVRKCS